MGRRERGCEIRDLVGWDGDTLGTSYLDIGRARRKGREFGVTLGLRDMTWQKKGLHGVWRNRDTQQKWKKSVQLRGIARLCYASCHLRLSMQLPYSYMSFKNVQHYTRPP